MGWRASVRAPPRTHQPVPMNVPKIDLPPADSGPGRRFSRFLEEGWIRGVERGAVSYNPVHVETLTFHSLRFHLLPGREERPRLRSQQGEPSGLQLPHQTCPFDTEEFLQEREVARIARAGRIYHIALNRYPVMRLHLLAIRPADEPPEKLPQRLLCADEIEDMLHLATLLAHPYRLFFNSNPGADGSRSGSSINHWHFQIFPCPWTVAARSPRITEVAGEVEIGQIPDWPARHRLYRSRNERILAEFIWADVEIIDRLDMAYNLEVSPRETGDLIGILFPRAPIEDIRIPSIGTLPGNFGGYELSGNVVVPGREVFEWIRSHPREAVALTLERMRAGTTWPLKITPPGAGGADPPPPRR